MKKNKLFSYKNMFLEDIARSIEFSVGLNRDYEDNIEVENIKGNFKEYFSYKHYSYLRYDFLREVSKLIVNIIQKGKAEAIIIKYKDEKNIVKGMEIRVPYNKYKIYGLKNIYYIQKHNTINSSKKYYVTKRKKEEIISINSKKLHINKFKMKKILKKLQKDDITNTLLMLSQKNLLRYGEFEKIKEKYEIRRYRATKEIRWDVRNSWPEFLNSPYILYRNVEFYKYIIKLLNFTINIINARISNQKDIGDKRKNNSKN